MATVEEAEAAISELQRRLAAIPREDLSTVPSTRLSVHLPDLGRTLNARLAEGRLLDIHHDLAEPRSGTTATARPPSPPDDSLMSKISLEMTSDVLVDLVDGRVSFARAWLLRKVSVRGSARDLALLRSFL